MPGFTADESAFMARALRLAERGRYTTAPNPVVGCVIVRNGAIVGEGWHERAGEAHAEVNALRAAGDAARGATAFVTLEPCSHTGRTPPCTAALLDAGIAEVVVATTDPNPAVDGDGLQLLEAGGVRVRSGLMAEAAEALNRGFLQRARHGRPRVRVKIAASLDGAIAMRSGESQWITGPEARADVQRLRAASGAIVTGIGTVLADDPALNVRLPGLPGPVRQPLRVVIDSALRMPLSAGMLALPGTTVLYCIDDARAGPLADAGAVVVRVGAEGDNVALPDVLSDLAAREVNDILVEAGPRLSGALLSQDLVDELVIYQAPHIMGSETMKMFATPRWTALSDRLSSGFGDVRRIGADLRTTLRLGD